MNKILVEVSVGELLDKISILEIKQEKIKNAESLKFIKYEYNILKAELDKNVKNDDKLKNLFNSLKEINSKLWVIEDDKRMCEKNKEFAEKFIKLSRDIHFLNDNRAKIKLEIKDINTKEAEKIISEFNKRDFNQTNTKKTQSPDKNKAKSKKISKK